MCPSVCGMWTLYLHKQLEQVYISEGGCNLTIVRYNYARMGIPFLTVPPLFVLLLADTVAAHQLGGFKCLVVLSESAGTVMQPKILWIQRYPMHSPLN